MREKKVKITSGILVWMTDNDNEIRTEFTTDNSFQIFVHSNIHEGLNSLNMKVTLKQSDGRLERQKLSQCQRKHATQRRKLQSIIDYNKSVLKNLVIF